jgi:hypothetical protein
MSMPKGYKVQHGYATVNTGMGGLGYREIAEKMTEEGSKMNHSTARNVFLSAMSKFATELFDLYNIAPSQGTIKQVSSDPRFQSGIMNTIVDFEDEFQTLTNSKT